MFKYYRLNESRWGLPEENDVFKYPDYEYEKRDKHDNEENFVKEDCDDYIKQELTKFYNENKDFIVTEYDKLDDLTYYDYIDFSYLTPDEINKIKEWHIFYYNKDKDKTYLVREVIRKYPKLNPSDILFSDLNYPSIVELSKKLSCAIKVYGFEYFNNSLNLRYKVIHFLGSSFTLYC